MIQRVYNILASIIFEIVLFLSNNARYMEKHCKKKKFKYYERTIEHVLNKIYNEWIVIIYEYKITLGNEIKLNSITISRTITEAKGDRAFWRENKFKLQIELFLHDDLEFPYNLQGKRIIDVYIYIWWIQGYAREKKKNLCQDKLQREIDESFARTYSPPSSERCD